jgi:DNA-binding transcriptional ArsR family regulator
MGSSLQNLLTEVPLSAALRERVERAIREIEDCGQRIAAVEAENEVLRTQIRAGPPVKLADDTLCVLVHLFKTDARKDRNIVTVARKLAMQPNVLQYHLDRLKESGLADIEGVHGYDGYISWAPTSKGLRHIVERKLT